MTPNSKLLTILMPVYNGEPYVGNLLSQFKNYVADLDPQHPFLTDVEIRLINNVSRDKTLEIAQHYSSFIPNLIVHDETEHMPTAEENIFRSFKYCLGKYTWVLGVDDFPVFENFNKTLDLLKQNQYDFLMFNLGTVDQSQTFVAANLFNFPGDTFKGNLVELTSLLGFWFVVAAISNQIIRTDYIRGYDIQALSKKTSPIYAHVVAYIEKFNDKACAIFNFPLVFYKVTYLDIDHWQGAARKLNVFDEYFWTLGFLKQIQYLEDKKIVPKNYFYYLLDRNEYIIFRPVFVVINKLISQLKLMNKPKVEARNLLSTEDMDWIISFIDSRDPYFRELLWKIQSFHKRILNKEKLKESDFLKLTKITSDISESFLFSPFFIEIKNYFEIYKIGSLYFAIYYDDRDFFLERFKELSFKDFAPFFFCSKDRNELYQKIEETTQKAIHAQNDDDSPIYKNNLHKFLPTHSEVKAFEKRIKKIEKKNEDLEKEMEHIFDSTSWKVTSPIRLIVHFLRKIFGR